VSAPTASGGQWETHPWVHEASQAVRFGLFGGSRGEWSALRDFVQMAEDLGFDGYWLGDHPVRQPGDCWTQLAALAVSTTRIRLGPLVSCVAYRPPALLARMAADVDRLSGGRLVLGLGIGSITEEFAMLGLPVAPARDRWAALAETVEIVQGLWRGEPVTYEGRHYRLQAAQMPGGPVQQPRVPLLIAGGGRSGLPLIARYADAANLGPHSTTGGAVSAADVRTKLAALHQACAAHGRPAGSLLASSFHTPVLCAATPDGVRAKLEAVPAATREFLGPALLAGTPDDLAAYYGELVQAGMTYFVAAIRPGDTETVQLLAEQVAPAVRQAHHAAG
jgi:alkanesulfonate monooxygenase SsuD/methylene tetrahydromethanopterin reductase-like flavin-dependent oxidoreductase (luciferase family)